MDTANNYNPQAQTAPQQGNETSIREIAYICLDNWKWFVFSIVMCLALATAYILRTPKSYTRTASVLIKEDNKGKSIGTDMAKAFGDMGIAASSSNVYNELHMIQSKDLARSVVKRLALNVNYTISGTFHAVTIYGEKLPIAIDFPAADETKTLSFDIDLEQSGKVKLTNFVYNGDKVDGEAGGQVGYNIIHTPVGRVIVRKTQYYNAENIKNTIHVSRASIESTTNHVVNTFKASLSEKQATVIDMSYIDVSPKRAEDVLSTIISVYNENWVKDKNQIAVSTSQFINERLQVIEKELGNVDDNISSFMSRNEITDIKETSKMYMEQSKTAETEALNISNQVYMAKYIRSYLANKSNTRQLLPANSGLESGEINAQINEYNAKMLQRNNISTDKNPIALDLDAQLESMRNAILATIDNEVKILEAKLQTMRGYGNEATAKITSTPNQAKYLLSVERQQKVKESLYLFLLQKREENELSQAFTAYNTRIIDAPQGSSIPTAPVSTNIMLIAFALGLFIPIGVIYLSEMMNTTVRGKKDIDTKVSMPYLGEVPLFLDNIDPKKWQFWKKKKQHKNVVVRHGSRGMVNEAFRVIGTNLEFLTKKDDEPCNVIMTTSYNPGSGKSFIGVNLGAILTLKKKRVLLLDGDLRHASLSSFIDYPAKGIADYLIGRVSTIDEIITHGLAFEGLDIIPVGAIPPNPSELLSTQKYADAIKYLRTKYDYILIDCPPANMMADATIIKEHVDHTIFVVRSGLFERAMLPQLEEDYKEGKLKNMSLILNGTYAIKSHYGYGYGYGYGYASHYGQKGDFTD